MIALMPYDVRERQTVDSVDDFCEEISVSPEHNADGHPLHYERKAKTQATPARRAALIETIQW